MLCASSVVAYIIYLITKITLISTFFVIGNVVKTCKRICRCKKCGQGCTIFEQIAPAVDYINLHTRLS